MGAGERKALAVVLVWLTLGPFAFAGDAVAIGYNAEGIWTTVTYYCSSTPKGGRDYKNEKEASETAVRDLRRRSKYSAARTEVLSSSDSTGFVAVARGADAAQTDKTVVGRGKTQAAADNAAVDLLQAAGAGAKYKIVYRYFSYGADAN
jgi:hypothetical protein